MAFRDSLNGAAAVILGVASVATMAVAFEGCTMAGSPVLARAEGHEPGDSSTASPDSSTGGGSGAPDAPDEVTTVAADASERDAGASDGTAATAGDAACGAADGEACVELTRVPGWSVRKRIGSSAGDVLLEEVLFGLASEPGASRLRIPAGASTPERSWVAPSGSYISDFCRHPSGALSAVTIAQDRTVSMVRLEADLTFLSEATIHDSAIAQDPHVTDAGALDLLANGLAPDAARIADVGEDVVVAVFSSWYSVIAYRASFVDVWSTPQRTLIEPPVGLTPFLPIGGSYDTFGAIVAWFRPLLATDETGNAYVAVWAGQGRVRLHDQAFHDGLPFPSTDSGIPLQADSDILLTKMDTSGARAWSRVVGSVNEDEPYAIAARGGQVAVVGRSRRAPGEDNTFWDAFVSVSSQTGDLVGSRTIAFDASSILLSVDALPDGGWVLGGSDGWSQNPSGLSVLTYGAKLLFELPSFDETPVRVALPAGPRHNEIRTVSGDRGSIWFGGHEDGPVMHTGDSDPSLIRATGVFGLVVPEVGRD